VLLCINLGSLQQRKATLQILSSATTFKRSTTNQWTQSSSIEECFNATNGHGTANAFANHVRKSNAANGEFFVCVLITLLLSLLLLLLLCGI